MEVEAVLILLEMLVLVERQFTTCWKVGYECLFKYLLPVSGVSKCFEVGVSNWTSR